ncbi:MAG: phosphoribosylanthranilate isomerase [Candidatus Gallimonas sp.]
MTKIKLCGLSRACDVATANELLPDYAGFVFAPNSKRYVSPQRAAELKRLLDPAVVAVGVFVNESQETVARLLDSGTIDVAQLHGDEDDAYIEELKRRCGAPVFKAFRIGSERDVEAARRSVADEILLDSGQGTGRAFEWSLLRGLQRRYFLAGGLAPENVREAIRVLQPYGVDVSSGIETDGKKDEEKMRAFVRAVREKESGT